MMEFPESSSETEVRFGRVEAGNVSPDYKETSDSDVVEGASWKSPESAGPPAPPGPSGQPGEARPPAPPGASGLPAPPGAAGRAVQVLLPVWVAMLFYIILALVNKLEDQSTF